MGHQVEIAEAIARQQAIMQERAEAEIKFKAAAKAEQNKIDRLTAQDRLDAYLEGLDVSQRKVVLEAALAASKEN